MDFVKHTIDLAIRNVEEGGRPFRHSHRTRWGNYCRKVPT